MSDTLTNTFANLAANGSTAALELPGDVNDIDVYLSDAAATFGGGTLTLYTSFDGGTTWVAVTSGAWTSGTGLLAAALRGYGKYIRLTLAGATSPSLTVTVVAKRVSQSKAVNVVATLAANGNTDFVAPYPASVAIFAKGTWDSGSLTLSVSPDGTLYVDSGLTAITANGGGVYANTGKNSLLRLVLASVVTASDLDVWAYYAPL